MISVLVDRTRTALAVSFVCAFALTIPATASASPDPVGTIYVADYGANKIDVFAPGANGNVAPIRTISGSATQLGGPADVAVDAAGDVYSSNFNINTITEYAPGASGNVAPIRTIAGSLTNLGNNDDFSLTPDGTLFVGNDSGPSPIVVFGPGQTGNVAPLRQLSGSNTGLSSVDGVGADATGTAYVANTGASEISVFAPGATGNVAPVRTIVGSNTGLSEPDDVKVGFSGQIVVSDANDSLLTFAPGASGNATPIGDISGSNTGLTILDDIAVDATGAIYATNFGPEGVLIFNAGANGNVAPSRTITGSATTFVSPEGIAVATPVSGLTLTTAAAPASISLGEAAADAATLSGGTSTSGSLVFKLFGPNDSTCSNAPAFTSSALTVTGNGTYTSPSFTPTASGTYSWVAEYSGDVNNPPLSGACGAASEALTVGPPDPPIAAAGAAAISGTAGKALTGITAMATDPDTTATPTQYSATISWGDGGTSSGTISGSGGKFTITGTHTYAKAGTYTVKSTIVDVDNTPNTASASTTAKIVSPSHPPHVEAAHATLKLNGIHGTCAARRARVQINGARISSVKFMLDGKQIKARTVHRGREYTAEIPLKTGRHHLTVKVTFVKSSHAKAKTLRRTLSGCRAMPPRFTG